MVADLLAGAVLSFLAVAYCLGVLRVVKWSVRRQDHRREERVDRNFRTWLMKDDELTEYCRSARELFLEGKMTLQAFEDYVMEAARKLDKDQQPSQPPLIGAGPWAQSANLALDKIMKDVDSVEKRLDDMYAIHPRGGRHESIFKELYELRDYYMKQAFAVTNGQPVIYQPGDGSDPVEIRGPAPVRRSPMVSR